MSKKSQKPVESEAEELARLREENKCLTEALKMAEWMNHAKDVMIDEAESLNVAIATAITCAEFRRRSQ